MAFPPEGSASVSPHTLQVTLFTALAKISCSFPHLRQFTRRKVLCGFGISLFHSVVFSPPCLAYDQFSQSNAAPVPHVTADFALKPQSLFLGGFGEFPLKRVLLSTVTFLFPFMMTLTLRQCTAFSRLV